MDKSVADCQILLCQFPVFGDRLCTTIAACCVTHFYVLFATLLFFPCCLFAFLPFFTFAVSRFTSHALKPRAHHGITCCVIPVEKSYIG